MIEQWLRYAAAFERAIEDSLWQPVSACFGSQATYERCSDDDRLVTALVTGRQNIVDNFEGSVSGFDRRFNARRINNVKLDVEGSKLRHHFKIFYQAPGAPDFEFSGSEVYEYDEAGLILSIQESLAPGVGSKLVNWLTEHGTKLKPAA